MNVELNSLLSRFLVPCEVLGQLEFQVSEVQLLFVCGLRLTSVELLVSHLQH